MESSIKSKSKMRWYVSDVFRKNYDITFHKNECKCDGKCGENCKCKESEEED